MVLKVFGFIESSFLVGRSAWRGKCNLKSFAAKIIKFVFLCCQNGNIFICSRGNAPKRDNFARKKPFCTYEKMKLYELHLSEKRPLDFQSKSCFLFEMCIENDGN